MELGEAGETDLSPWRQQLLLHARAVLLKPLDEGAASLSSAQSSLPPDQKHNNSKRLKKGKNFCPQLPHIYRRKLRGASRGVKLSGQ